MKAFFVDYRWKNVDLIISLIYQKCDDERWKIIEVGSNNFVDSGKFGDAALFRNVAPSLNIRIFKSLD